jgi:hypothetical protein
MQEPQHAADVPSAAKTPRTLKLRHVVAVSLAMAVLAASATAYASHQFNDVPDSNPFHDHIDWLADTGITGGFPDGGFHPNEAVQRQQMAAFMARSYNLVSGLTTVDTGSGGGASGIDTWTNVSAASAQVTIPNGTSGRILGTFSGGANCNFGDNVFILVAVVRPQCQVRLLVNGTPMAPGEVTVMDSDDGAETDLAVDQEGFSMQAASATNRPPGTYTVTAQINANDANGNVDDQLVFELTNWTLTAQVLLNDNNL